MNWALPKLEQLRAYSTQFPHNLCGIVANARLHGLGLSLLWIKNEKNSEISLQT